MRDQEPAVCHIFHFERSSFYYRLALMVRSQCSTSLPVFSTQLHQTQDLNSCPPEPYSMKTTYGGIFPQIITHQ